MVLSFFYENLEIIFENRIYFVGLFENLFERGSRERGQTEYILWDYLRTFRRGSREGVKQNIKLIYFFFQSQNVLN
jgi:hypothetical protein